MPTSPDSPIVDWSASVAGPLEWTAVSPPTAPTRVFRGDGGPAPVWLKVHPSPRKFRQESRAYATLVPWLADAGLRVPTLLAEDPSLGALLLDHVAGRDVRTLEPDALPAAFRAAGAALRRIQTGPVDPDPLPLDRAMAARIEATVERARPHVEPEWLARAEQAMDRGRAFVGVDRVACHRDFSPRNWRIDDAGTLGLIDFEHARADAPMADLVRLEEGAFDRFPHLRAPFVEGFGRPLSPEEQARLGCLRWLSALGTVAWGVEHADAAFEARGRRALETLRALDG